MTKQAKFFGVILVICLICAIIGFVMAARVTVTDTKIEKQITNELIGKATDDGADGDDYIVYLYRATKEHTEDNGRHYIAYIIGSGTDENGEWKIVKYVDGEVSFYNINFGN